MRTLATADRAPINRYSFANQVWFNASSTILALLKDRQTFIGATGVKLQMSTNVDQSTATTTPTWTDIYSFPPGRSPVAITLLANGEVMVATTTAGWAGWVYLSTGWATNPLTATWSLVLTATGGNGGGYRSYCMHQWSHGTDGTVLFSESGAQSTGNAGADVTAARRVYLSRNFGADNFNGGVPILDLLAYATAQGVPNAQTMHLHGVAYDEDDRRIYVIFGDDNYPHAGLVAGAGYAQCIYSDDFGVTWQKLPQPATAASWPATSHAQYLNLTITKSALIFAPDVSLPGAIVVYPKNGYRNLGDGIIGPAMGTTGVGGLNTRVDMKVRCPIWFSGQVYNKDGFTQGRYLTIPMTDDDGLTWSSVQIWMPAQNPLVYSFGFNAVWGPTRRGKMVASGTGMYINNDATKKSMVADLVSPSDAISFMATVKVNAAYAMTEDDQVVIADATTAGFAVAPPPQTVTNKTFTVKKPATDVSSNVVTIAGLDGTTISLSTPGASVSFVSDGAAFNITAKV
jgi:hypothetical protein